MILVPVKEVGDDVVVSSLGWDNPLPHAKALIIRANPATGGKSCPSRFLYAIILAVRQADTGNLSVIPEGYMKEGLTLKKAF